LRKTLGLPPRARDDRSYIGRSLARQSNVVVNAQRRGSGIYSGENKSVTAPRLLLETRWRYFASTPEV
jgi:hypothetical protein